MKSLAAFIMTEFIVVVAKVFERFTGLSAQEFLIGGLVYMCCMLAMEVGGRRGPSE